MALSWFTARGRNHRRCPEGGAGSVPLKAAKHDVSRRGAGGPGGVSAPDDGRRDRGRSPATRPARFGGKDAAGEPVREALPVRAGSSRRTGRAGGGAGQGAGPTGLGPLGRTRPGRKARGRDGATCLLRAGGSVVDGGGPAGRARRRVKQRVKRVQDTGPGSPGPVGAGAAQPRWAVRRGGGGVGTR